MDETTALILRELAALPQTPELGVIILNLLANLEGLTAEQIHTAIKILRKR